MKIFDYVRTLLCDGQSLEYYCEGTRSRSGKMLHPKTGMLTTITDLYQARQVPNVLFVPVAINYEMTIESAMDSDELLGENKIKVRGRERGMHHSRAEAQQQRSNVNAARHLKASSFFFPHLVGLCLIPCHGDQTIATNYNRCADLLSPPCMHACACAAGKARGAER